MDIGQEFEEKLKKFADGYAAIDGDSGKAAFASSSQDLIAELYGMKDHLDMNKYGAEFSLFKKIADELAWKTGQPESARVNFDQHKSAASWVEDGSDMVLNLKTDWGKCSPELRAQIIDDFKKMTKCDWKDEFFDSSSFVIKIPRPESLRLKAALKGGNEIAEKDLGDMPISSSFIDKTVVDAWFNAWDAYQKKIFAAANSPEEMMATFCELSLLLPLNFLNESVSGLTKWLKEWAKNSPGASARKTPRTPGGSTPAPSEPNPDAPNPDTPESGNHSPDAHEGDSNSSHTIGELHEMQMYALMEEKLEEALLRELSRMDNPKNKALFNLMNDCKTKAANPNLTDVQKAMLLEERRNAVEQFRRMIPFIVKHARENGNKEIDAFFGKDAEGNDFIFHAEDRKKALDTCIDCINAGLTPYGQKITGQTSPDFEQLWDKLKGKSIAEKRNSFRLSYEGISDPKVRNNALVKAVNNIINEKGLTTKQRQERFNQLLHSDTVWTPEDLDAASQLAEKLNSDNNLEKPLRQVPIKPYAQENEDLDIVNIARKDSQALQKALDHEAEDGLPDTIKGKKDADGSVFEKIDVEKGTITLRVQEGTDKSYYITYSEAQQRVVCIDRNGKMMTEPIDIEKAGTDPRLQDLCQTLSDHFSIIKDGKTPFARGTLKDTFSNLRDSNTGNFKDIPGIDR